MSTATDSVDFYQLLHVAPGAPLELISASYWRLTVELQRAETSDQQTRLLLYHLSHAYRVLSDARARAAYDNSLPGRPAAVRPTPARRRRRGLLLRFLDRRHGNSPAEEDYYSLLGLHPQASATMVTEAYSIMRDYYLRLLRSGRMPATRLLSLNEAYRVISDPAGRSQYDKRLKKVAPEKTPGEPSPPARLPKEKAKPQPRARTSRKKAVAKSRPAANAVNSRRLPALHLGAKARAGARLSVTLAGLSLAALWRTLKWAARTSGRAALRVAGWARTSLAAMRANRPTRPHAQRRRGAASERERIEELIVSRLTQDQRLARQRNGAGADGLTASFVDEQPGGVQFVVAGPATIGSGEDCDIQLTGVDAHTARLLLRDGQFLLLRLARSGGLVLNGSPIEIAVLRDEDVLECGNYRLRIRLGAPGCRRADQ